MHAKCNDKLHIKMYTHKYSAKWNNDIMQIYMNREIVELYFQIC